MGRGGGAECGGEEVKGRKRECLRAVRGRRKGDCEMGKGQAGELELRVTERQGAFMTAEADEVLFGGAAGGGKSFGQLVDALVYALRYPGSKQLILRRTFAELEKSLIRVSLGLYPKALYNYNATMHIGRFKNGSLIDFGYSANEGDVFQYQSAEYDVIRFDELTHFTEFQYLYMLSRLRGTNGYPKQMKSSTNPGGIGHAWVKERFVDPAEHGTEFVGEDGSRRVFLPSRIDDNPFLMAGDPDYKRRLLALPEAERRALLLGEWDLFEGRFFREFSYAVHTVDPTPLPAEWRRYRAIDYGLDRLACLWFAVDPEGAIYLYREYCESDLIISEAARRILEATPQGEKIYATLAPPDLFSRGQESGRSRALIFAEHGLTLTKSDNNRETGWLALKELLRVGGERAGARLRIFRSCREVIRCLPLLECDDKGYGDVKTEPHEITHAPDALRYFAIYYSRPAPIETSLIQRPWTVDMWQDYERAVGEEREYLLRKYGMPKGAGV